MGNTQRSVGAFSPQAPESKRRKLPALGTIEIVVSYPRTLQENPSLVPSTNFTETAFDSALLALREKYPAYNVWLRARAVNEYNKFLPFKNGDPATPAVLKPTVVVYIPYYPSVQNEVRDLLQSHLDPQDTCSFYSQRLIGTQWSNSSFD